MKRAIPIGQEDFRTIIEKGFCYVDKTRMIQELLDSGTSVSLFTRPRRFGKTLNLSMIRRFFEQECDAEGQKRENGHLFDGLFIASCGEKYLAHQQQYPVISLSLKSARQPDYETACRMLARQIAEEAERHRYLLRSRALSEAERKKFRNILEGEETLSLYTDALRFLSCCLAKHHGRKVILLLDEYDVPLEHAWERGFYEPMVDFIRALFESALKTNPSLEFAVITGCLRISRESIFTGLNHLEVHSILTPYYADCFGFTEEEVVQLLASYGLEEKLEEVKRWYNGYQFGKWEMYNPWSIVNYVKMADRDPEAFPRAYWSNTSSNSIIRRLIQEASPETKREIECLLAGGSIEKPVHEAITYADAMETEENLWNFLYFTGYLKQTGIRQEEDGSLQLELAIPNKEVGTIYRRAILNWFGERLQKTDRRSLFSALEEGDCAAIERILSEQLLETISFFDYGESYYHGFLTGLLKGWEKYEVQSNRESGLGRADLILKEWSFRGKAILLELKTADSYGEMERGCEKALAQIEAQDYEASLRAEGREEILKYGICFYRKGCLVRKAEG